MVPATRMGGLLLALAVAVACGQDRFLAADVHASAAAANPSLQGGVLRGGRIEIRQATVVDLIRLAWGINPDLVFGGPAWLDWSRFDVIAESPAGTAPAAVQLMLRGLLTERFQLAVHRDTRPVPGYVLTIGKGRPNLKEASGSGETGCRAHQQPADDGVPYWLATCRNMTMEAFSESLSSLDTRYVAGPVADQTGLRGAWDFDLKWTDKRTLSYAGNAAVNLFHALERQLGLKLSPGTVPMPVLVVDRVNQTPAPNSPEVANLLPPVPPPEFEVASVRRSPPGAPPGRRLIEPGGRIEMRGAPLFLLIIQAWGLDVDPEEDLPGRPKWLTAFEPSFDIVAKAPARSVSDGAMVSEDDFDLMLRALLADRFRMSAHYESRPMDAYNLVAVKPRLRKAEPSTRAGCRTERSPVNGISQITATCRNMTLARFAEQLQYIATNYLRYPVLDDSRIEGALDFSLTFSAIPPNQAGAGEAGPRGGGGAGSTRNAGSGDQMSGVSLFQALEKQLGLKLEKHKRPEPVFVIDHIEEKPTEN